jgi:hypothetical protein
MSDAASRHVIIQPVARWSDMSSGHHAADMISTDHLIGKVIANISTTRRGVARRKVKLTLSLARTLLFLYYDSSEIGSSELSEQPMALAQFHYGDATASRSRAIAGHSFIGYCRSPAGYMLVMRRWAQHSLIVLRIHEPLAGTRRAYGSGICITDAWLRS